VAEAGNITLLAGNVLGILPAYFPRRQTVSTLYDRDIMPFLNFFGWGDHVLKSSLLYVYLGSMSRKYIDFTRLKNEA